MTLTADETQFVEQSLRVLLDKKAEDPVVIDLREESIPTGFFVVVGADNPVHAKALVTALRKELPRKPRQSEGLNERRWIVLDYGDVTIHVFQREARKFYDLDSLWADKRIEIEIEPEPPGSGQEVADDGADPPIGDV